MEALVSVIGAIVAEPCRFVFGYVQASIKSFFKWKSNFNALTNDMSSLMNLKNEVQQKLGLKDEQLGVVPRSQVEGWVRKVDELKTKMDEFQSTISTTDGNNLQDSCCPFPLQCKLSSNLARKIIEAKQLMQAGNEMFEKMGDVRDRSKPVEHIPGPSIIGQKTASQNLARVLDLLSKDDVTRIGVWGMGGVGKTTLVQNLNNEIGKMPSAQGFSVIIWATVSKETNLRKIQTRIAERLNLEVKVELDEESMASRLHDRLLKEGRFLLILDDVWEEIKLDRLGIPRQELCPFSKIIITSRSLDVCRMMETQTDLQVKALNDEEAWKLFHERVGEVVMKGDIRPLAETVARECDGLPLAINAVGASMRGKFMVPLWEDALKALQMSEPLIEGIEEKVFKSLKWSYDSLKSKPKFCFLFCCLYPEDFNINVDELVRYWFCEGLLDERLNYDGIRNRGIAIVQSLRDCCLLEEGKSENTVKMHDVVRDVGIWIAESVEDECRSLVRSGIGLTSVSEKEFLSSYKRQSFMNNQIASLPDCVVQCEDVSTLLLKGNEKLGTLPASFLEGFQTLKILDLSRTNITSLPSLLQLQQLRALVLSKCGRLTKLPPLDSLSRLQLLDCSSSGITQLPQNLEKLINLRQLDMSDTRNLKTISYSALSKLSKLELLKLPYVGEGQRLFEVLPFLNRLIVLYVKLDSIPHLTSDNVNGFKRIKEFHIIIETAGREGKIWRHPEMTENSIILSDVCLLHESIEWLLCNANYWYFEGCEGLTQMFIKLVTDNVSFASMKELEISKSDISFGGGVASFDLLPNLEIISLKYLSKLESVSDLSKLVGLRFSRLKRIIIKKCDQLKCVISLEENQTLEKLERIDVSDCEMLKSLFDYPNPRAQHMKQNPTAPNIRVVSLKYLPNLENLCGNDESWQNVREIKLVCCHGIRKLPLTAQNAESIKKITGEKGWWNGLEWDSEDTKMLLRRRFRAQMRRARKRATKKMRIENVQTSHRGNGKDVKL